MDTAAILHDLAHAKGLPREALAAANERRSELTPGFLAEIEAWLAAGPKERAEPSPLFFIIHLLASWGETAAYRPLARLLRAPSDDISALLEDATTELAHRVMASVFDGDPAPLYEVIHDPEADEYVRSRMFDTLAMLVHWVELDRGEVTRFLAEAWEKLQPQGVCFVWEGWQGAIALLGLAGMEEQVRSAFARGFIDEAWMDYEDFERDLALALESPDQVFDGPTELYQRIGDVAAEMEDWHFGSDSDWGGDDLDEDLLDGESEAEATYAAIGSLFNSGRDWLPEQPFVKFAKDVGRNDPCPCGSGKKYKKCCGR